MTSQFTNQFKKTDLDEQRAFEITEDGIRPEPISFDSNTAPFSNN